MNDLPDLDHPDNPFASEEITPAYSAEWDARRRVAAAIRRLTDPAPDGLGMSARGLTMSTVGLVPAIDRLAGEGIPVTLALSLHAPDDELRDELVPINTRWRVDEALDAAYRYFEATGRRVSIEYALIRDINDQSWRADLLGEKLARRGRGHRYRGYHSRGRRKAHRDAWRTGGRRREQTGRLDDKDPGGARRTCAGVFASPSRKG